jgi:arylsulfatase
LTIPEHKKPNILLIMTDQQRFDSLGCYGNNFVPTPNLDLLAKNGILYEQCYVNNTICTPSRASLFTGKPLPGHGVYQLHDRLSDHEVLFPQRLREAGYKTALFGKLHVEGRMIEAKRRHPNDGFDIYENALCPTNLDIEDLNSSYGRWLAEEHPGFYEQMKLHGRKIGHIPEEVHFTRWAADCTIDFIRNHRGEGEQEQPFFACLSLFDPHDPYNNYPETMHEVLSPKDIPAPQVVAETMRPEGVMREQEHSYLGGFSQYTADQIAGIRFGYYAAIAYLDREIGRVLNMLEQEGLTDNTVVIFTSDHGDMIGDRQLLAKGAFFYDPCTKVPLLMRLPKGGPSGIRISSLVQLHDIAPTLLQVAGYGPEDIRTFMPEAVSLLNALGSDLSCKRQTALCLYRNTGISDNKQHFDPPIHATMLRVDPYKLNVYHDPEQPGGGGIGELFDLEQDPKEEVNLWGRPEYAELKSRLLCKLMDWLIAQEIRQCGSPSGGAFPETKHWVLNNAL